MMAPEHDTPDCTCPWCPEDTVPAVGGDVLSAAEREASLTEAIAHLWRQHTDCTWTSTGVNVVWSCGIIHDAPIHMQPTTRDRHLAALVMTQVEADRLAARAAADEEARGRLAAVEAVLDELDDWIGLGPGRSSPERVEGFESGIELAREKVRAALVAPAAAQPDEYPTGPPDLAEQIEDGATRERVLAPAEEVERDRYSLWLADPGYDLAAHHSPVFAFRAARDRAAAHLRAAVSPDHHDTGEGQP